jgi:hypothetical protein
VYRDDQCAVCGAALPPDHVYCREHAAEVDDRLHRIGATLTRVLDDLPELAQLIGEIAPETWEWLSDEVGADDEWPPALGVHLQLHADQVDVDVDREPGRVRVDLATELRDWVDAAAGAMERADLRRVARACADASGADAAY